ncbi:MAG: YceI family protein [Bacteroidales bacterium]|nr:YceI family protein [Bacteroidales bacterium]
MKIFVKFIALAFIVALTACASGGPKTETRDAAEVKSADYDLKYEVNLEQSVVAWEGYKPTGTHNGTVAISDGKLKFNEGALVGGTFTIDLTSIKVLDLTDPDMNAKLTGHLLSADFFEVETYPAATFEITGVEAVDGSQVDLSKEKGDIIPTHAISGNLTMKDVTKNLTFHARVMMEGDMFMAQTNMFFIDRVDWNVQYGSKKLFADLKDNFINDEMGLAITLQATKVNDETASSN